MTRECNVCFKSGGHLHKCFINNKCSFRMCGSCVGKSLSFNRENLDVILKCPNCRKDSIFNRHTKITKMIKGNRGILLNIFKEQRQFIRELQQRLANVNHYTNIINLTTEPVIDIAGNEIPSVMTDADLEYFALNYNTDTPSTPVPVVEGDGI